MSQASDKVAFCAVIPAYNREHVIGRAIESALAQSEPPAELIVVDDGSRDGTRDAVLRYGSAVRYIHQQNAGASEARNSGVRAATCEWIAFLDSDDYWLPGHLARVGAAIRGTQGRALLYFSDMRRTPEEGADLLWDFAGFSIDGAYALREDAADWALMPIQPMMLQTSVVRRGAYLEVGGLRRSLACRHDTHLFLKLCLGRPACAVAGCGAEQTSDDRGGGRVTAAFGTLTEKYWHDTLEMYEDVLGGAFPLSAAQRRDLDTRLAVAHLRLARYAWRTRHGGRAAAHLLRAAARSPQRFLAGLRSLAAGAARPA